MRRCVIFDLDGTLTQSEEGIFNCVAYAVEKMQWKQPDAQTLRKFIGPPLQYSFHEYLGMTEEQAQKATTLYRERYTTVGLFENRVYPGIRTLLRALKQRGDWVAVATGKPQGPSERILAHFGLDRWIDRIVGPVNSADAGKAELIRAALPETWDTAYMVGDRKFDIEGGKAAGTQTIGAGYGYGSEEELRESGCDLYAGTVDELTQQLCGDQPLPRGQFLSMEGLDGSGKSTQLRLLTDALERYGFEVVHSREPGGCPISEKIREIILDRANEGMTAETEAYLYAASRAQHVHDVILPAIRSGKLLLSDRFIDSSIAYQGGGRKLGVEEVMDMNRYAINGLFPDLTVFLDLPHQTALSRRYGASEPDRIEIEGEPFHARVEAAYREMIGRHPERFVAVDASRPAEVIGDEVARNVISRLMKMEESNG